jgi:hypothetical protein
VTSPLDPLREALPWHGLTEGERDQVVSDLVEYGTGFVAPLYAVVEGIERKLMERNSPTTAAAEGGIEDALGASALGAPASPSGSAGCAPSPSVSAVPAPILSAGFVPITELIAPDVFAVADKHGTRWTSPDEWGISFERSALLAFADELQTAAYAEGRKDEAEVRVECGNRPPDVAEFVVDILCRMNEAPGPHIRESWKVEIRRAIVALRTDRVPTGPATAELTRSQKLTAAGFTRRPSVKTAGGLMREEEPAAAAAMRAMEELHQLGYTLKGNLWYPPLYAAPTGVAAEPMAPESIAGYLFIQRKPGTVSEFVSVAPDGSEGWPLDGWHTVTRVALVEAGPREEIWRNEKLIAALAAMPQGEPTP